MKITSFEFIPKNFEHKKIDKDLWEILVDITCNLGINDNEFFEYIIRKGFKTNYRSGPQWLNKIAPKFGDSIIKLSWMIHDANYEGYLSQKAADKLLYFMLIEGGLNEINSEVIFLGLRLFGGFNYSENKNNPYIAFEHKIIPVNNNILENSETISEELNNEEDFVFDTNNKKLVSEKLNEIATENRFVFENEDIEQYYR